MLVVLPVAQLLVVHQVSKRLRGDGHHVGEDEAAVAAGRQHQLVVAVVVADAPHPAWGGRNRDVATLASAKEVEIWMLNRGGSVDQSDAATVWMIFGYISV